MKIITLILITIISSIAISVLVLLSNYGKHSTLLYDIILHDTIYIYIYMHRVYASGMNRGTHQVIIRSVELGEGGFGACPHRGAIACSLIDS